MRAERPRIVVVRIPQRSLRVARTCSTEVKVRRRYDSSVLVDTSGAHATFLEVCEVRLHRDEPTKLHLRSHRVGGPFGQSIERGGTARLET